MTRWVLHRPSPEGRPKTHSFPPTSSKWVCHFCMARGHRPLLQPSCQTSRIGIGKSRHTYRFRKTGSVDRLNLQIKNIIEKYCWSAGSYKISLPFGTTLRKHWRFSARLATAARNQQFPSSPWLISNRSDSPTNICGGGYLFLWHISWEH